MTGVRRAASGVRSRAAGLLVAALFSASCARVMPPPGGERDETPPEVLSISPAPMSTVRASDDAVVIDFAERISENGVEDAVYVSPVTGSVDVTAGRHDIEIEMAGGWQPGRVYRVVVKPTIRDLFNNQIARPIEFAFSTGGEFSAAAAAGVAYERVTGDKVPDVRVEAHPVGGGAYHLALTDTGGVYRLPLLPPGTYLLRGYADQNRDRRRDSFEPADSMTIEVGQADTVLRALALMRPDSTPANVTRVQVVDSVTLRVQFDDYMDVSEPQQVATVSVRMLPDSSLVGLAGIYYPHALTAERARQDSIRRDSIAAANADSVDASAPAPPRDTVAAPGRVSAARDSATADTIPPDPLVVRVREAALLPAREAPLPARELMVVLEQPLVPEAQYVVQVGGILNLAGVAGGGGSITFRAPAAPRPPAHEQPAVEGEPAADPEAEVTPPEGTEENATP